MDYISIDNFEGPLDLLLHLVKDSNIDICDISIEDITAKYLDYIKDVCNNNYYDGAYYIIDPNNNEYAYMVTVSHSQGDSVTVTYEYQEKPYYMI